MTRFSGSYDPDDVTFLLTPIALAPVDLDTKEALIQSGARHYSEMLSRELPPTDTYMALYRAALARNGARLGVDIASLAAALDARARSGEDIVLASLARGGTPIGVLLRRALVRRGRRVAHYAISILRGRGIDGNALAHIAARHDPSAVVFVDGWTGKGAIATELATSLAGTALGIRPFLTVVADPAGRADLCATHDDYLIASGLLGAVVSGLVSRSVLRTDTAFHGCVIYDHLARFDVSRAFVEAIDALAKTAVARPLAVDHSERAALQASCDALLATAMQTHERNWVKPGIAEATRVMLRRVPDQLWVRDESDPDVAHLLHLAKAHEILVRQLPHTSQYRALALIKPVAPR